MIIEIKHRIDVRLSVYGYSTAAVLHTLTTDGDAAQIDLRAWGVDEAVDENRLMLVDSYLVSRFSGVINVIPFGPGLNGSNVGEANSMTVDTDGDDVRLRVFGSSGNNEARWIAEWTVRLIPNT